MQEILFRKDILAYVENYLCLALSEEMSNIGNEEKAVNICVNTLAYTLASEKEKSLLIRIFQKIEENIQKYSIEELRRYSNAMLGIGLSSKLETWIVENEIVAKRITEKELLPMIVDLYLQLNDELKYPDHIQSICNMWIEGKTPVEINDEENIGITEIESICSKKISYELNFLIGNICDLIDVDENDEEEIDPRNMLALLQKKVKYGVSNQTAISVCESIVNDRLLAMGIVRFLGDENIGTDKIINVMKIHKEEIFNYLDAYPKYFTDKLDLLL